MNDQESPRVTPDMITAAIVSSDFHVLPGTQITVCAITLRNGAKVLGYNYGAIDPARQSWEQGRQAAYDMAREKIWELEGYALRERLAAGQKAGDRDALLKSAVDRFLCWDLPNDFAPDCHVSFDRDMAKQGRRSWPTGTNLLTAEQALAMFRHCLPSGPGVTGGAVEAKLTAIVRAFLDKHHVSCAETIHQTDYVIENAYGLIEDLAEVVGYYQYPEDAE